MRRASLGGTEKDARARAPRAHLHRHTEYGTHPICHTRRMSSFRPPRSCIGVGLPCTVRCHYMGRVRIQSLSSTTLHGCSAGATSGDAGGMSSASTQVCIRDIDLLCSARSCHFQPLGMPGLLAHTASSADACWRYPHTRMLPFQPLAYGDMMPVYFLRYSVPMGRC